MSSEETVVEEIAREEASPAAAEQQGSELIDELAGLIDRLEEDKPFTDLDQLFDTEHVEKLGRPFDWPAMPGAQVHIAHFTACVDKKSELEEKVRQKKGKLPGEKLSNRVEERLWEEAMFGTVVKGWSGIKKGGYEFPFNQANYRALMKVRRFRSFVLEKARDADGFRSRSAEELSGNSPAA